MDFLLGGNLDLVRSDRGVPRQPVFLREFEHGVESLISAFSLEPQDQAQ